MTEGSLTTKSDAWYTEPGPENDVVLSTKVRFSRNLANFPFPNAFKGDDASRIQAIVFDSVARTENADSFQAISVAALDHMGSTILTERGVLSATAMSAPGAGIIMRTDGRLSCLVNDVDHVRISSFASGLDGDRAFAEGKSLDDQMQKTVQFAASYDFGYLTSSVADAGSGMKVSVRLHLPSVSFSGKLLGLFEGLQEKNLSISACFGAGRESGASLGSYYQLNTVNSCSGSELDQMTGIIAAAKYCAESERRLRKECLEKSATSVQDLIYRSFARVKFSSLMTLREAVEDVSRLKWGKDLGLLTGIENTDLHALLYRIQEGHLQFLLKNGTFNFPADISENKALQIQRLRALIMQEAFEQTEIVR